MIPAERALKEARAIVAAASLLARAGFTIRQVRPVRDPPRDPQAAVSIADEDRPTPRRHDRKVGARSGVLGEDGITGTASDGGLQFES